MSQLKGICAALSTPMNDDGTRVDLDGLKKHLDTMMEAGVGIVAVCGGTGEFPFLTTAEKRTIAETAAKHIDGCIKLIVQTSAIRTEDAIEASLHAQGIGADALLLMPPYFEGPDENGVYGHFERIAGKVDTPFMVYNIPVHTGFDITPAFFARLQEIDNVQYIKNTTNDFGRVQQLVLAGAPVFNGADPFAFDALAIGAPGCFWGAVNAMPREAAQLYQLVAANKLTEARDLWLRMLPANQFFWTHSYNASVKAATCLRIQDIGPCRLPVLPLSAAEMTELKAALAPLDR